MGESALEDLKKKLESSAELVIGGSLMSFEYDELDEFLQEKARRELRETPEVVHESVKALCDMLADEEDLFLPLETVFLQKFLRRCKYYPESAFKLIKRYYGFKRKHPELFDNLLPSNERGLLVSGIFTPLPRRTSEGVRIAVIEAGGKWKPSEISLSQIFRGIALFLEVAMSEHRTQVAGLQVIIDMDGLTLSHIPHFSPSFASALIEYIGKCMPCRLKGVHIVNQSFIFGMAFAFFRPFIHGKVRDRIYFHGQDTASLLRFFNTESLPKKYGGEFDMPNEPVGEPLYDYAYIFEDFLKDVGRYGYVNEI